MKLIQYKQANIKPTSKPVILRRINHAKLTIFYFSSPINSMLIMGNLRTHTVLVRSRNKKLKIVLENEIRTH